MFCTDCGSRIADGQRFCHKCGHQSVTAEARGATIAPTAPDGRPIAIATGVLALVAAAFLVISIFPDRFSDFPGSTIDFGWQSVVYVLGYAAALATAGALTFAFSWRPGVAACGLVGLLLATEQSVDVLNAVDFDLGTGAGYAIMTIAAVVGLAAAACGFVTVLTDGGRPTTTGAVTLLLGVAAAVAAGVGTLWPNVQEEFSDLRWVFDSWSLASWGVLATIIVTVALPVIAGVLGGLRGSVLAACFAVLLFSHLIVSWGVANDDDASAELTFAFWMRVFAFVLSVALAAVAFVGETSARRSVHDSAAVAA